MGAICVPTLCAIIEQHKSAYICDIEYAACSLRADGSVIAIIIIIAISNVQEEVMEIILSGSECRPSQ